MNSSASSAKLYSYDSLANSDTESPLALSHQLAVERKRNKTEKAALLAIILILISYGTFLHVSRILNYPSDAKGTDAESRLVADLRALIFAWSASEPACQAQQPANTDHASDTTSYTDMDHAMSHALLTDYLRYNHSHTKGQGTAALPCVHPLLVQMSKSRVRELLYLARANTTLSADNRTGSCEHRKLCTSQILSDLHFSYDSLFEYDVTAPDHSSASLAAALRLDPLRVERFKAYNLYGSYYKSPYLIETWAHSTAESCPVQIRQRELHSSHDQARFAASTESRQACMLQLLALLQKRQARAR